MAELRYHPLTKDWVMIASHRQNRPQMPKDWCPFCPGSGKVPDDYEVYEYDNDFPALSQDPSEPDDVANDFFKVKPAYGKCEVILYSPGHTTTLPELTTQHITKLVNLWAERFEKISEDEKVKYVFIFENRGEAVGVTMPHPHGQIYGYSFVPKKIQLELDSAKEYHEEKDACIFCDMLKEEEKFEQRIIFKNEHFTVFLPFFTEYPYGVYVFSNAHKQNIAEFNEEERVALAQTLKETVGMFDSLFDYNFPYMMCMHNAPVNGEDTSEYYHFHIEFFPPMRSADKIKFNASSETGAWAHCNTTAPEAAAVELREAHEKFLKKMDQ
ncbi:galactose-1-phosphate uridylyltransferase [Candidatus Soleaferrea massiliensis]|uniref:galactose-1-phosphate uridylyltransferase n=1 Tax=Candidatus Soleaferrea massiliensis TaxID=1470354 RepID=UPI000590718F|nr:galactose-1-phosphate uridylyltransferase [Candidatus Soleaferrea massiliensis]